MSDNVAKTLTAMVFITQTADVGAQSWSTLPPPPAAVTSQQQRYMLALVVNGQQPGNIVQVQFHNGHYLLQSEDLRLAGIQVPTSASALTDINLLPDVTVHYDRQRQRLLLTVPPQWLPGQVFHQDNRKTRYPGRSSRGALVNYDIYASRNDKHDAQLALLHEIRLFGDEGQWHSSGVFQQRLAGYHRYPGDEGYIRFDSWWQNQNEENALHWRLGDVITGSLPWSSSIRLGGLQFSRDFSLRPDIITWPLPVFSGQTALPSTLDLFINGTHATSNHVRPGPWTLMNMPFINGAGNAVVVTTDAVGRQVTTTLPFYVSGDLLKPGLSDFSFSMGAIRKNYAIKNADYGSPATDGTYRYGLTDWLTLESHFEGSRHLLNAGGGAQLRVATFGVATAALAQSTLSGAEGRQYHVGYSYANSRFSIGTLHTRRSKHYANLALYSSRNGDLNDFRYTLSRRSAQYNASLSLNRFGNLGTALIDIHSNHGDKTRLWNLSWSTTLWGNSSLFVSASRDNRQQNWSAAISLTVPFGSQSNASITVERDPWGENAQRLALSRSMASDGGFAWDGAWTTRSSHHHYRQASLRYRQRQLEAAAGVYGEDHHNTLWSQLRGALVMMEGRLFAANEVNDAFVLVKTDWPDVGILYENQPAGHTDQNGYLLLSRVSAYYPASYALNLADLPADVMGKQTEHRFAVKRQSGYLLHFPVQPLRGASVILVDEQQQPLPVASRVITPGQPPTAVGWDGLVWLENIKKNQTFSVTTPDGRQCETSLSLSHKPIALQTYGPVVCVLSGSLPVKSHP